eukprot:CAMPEP_0115477414 /NCGR_PEP_ID=MMETSP0271-20121206/55659_1 /TAXON_ID=71861 /ORGANISM="Scrippsiella trochoidea, Strain CCMP3099" /LENGTH=215 /DNA_ID=CAMNT_0002904895 /DNA_START=36 /DNA_END=683 /DNA_ORIENTATION=+
MADRKRLGSREPCRRMLYRSCRRWAICSLAVFVLRQEPRRHTFVMLSERSGWRVPRGITRRERAPIACLANREELIAQAAAVTTADISPVEKGDILLNTVVFIGATIPFLYATWEFWRRIAFGQQFGTGDDPVVFPKPGEENQPLVVKEEAPRKKPRVIGKEGKLTIGMDADTNRGRRVLGQDALLFAYFLMLVAAGSALLTGVTVIPTLSTVFG